MIAAWFVALSVAMVAPGPTAWHTAGQGETEPVLEGLWPTERMIESMIRRTALEAADRYDLTKEQRRRVEGQMLARWPKFLGEHRRELQPLVNEYVEARLSLEPPSREQVRAWASRALPWVQQVQEQIEAGNAEVRRLLTPAQRVKFEAQVLKTSAGIQFFRDQLARWEKGEFAQEEVWDRPLRFKGEAGKRAPVSAAARGPAGQVGQFDAIESELAAWDRYVMDFIARHKLDEGQRATARSILQEVKERAAAHRGRHLADIRKLEGMIEAGRSEAEADLRAELERLYGPVDALFGELADRLNKLPTRAQRRTATQPAK